MSDATLTFELFSKIGFFDKRQIGYCHRYGKYSSVTLHQKNRVNVMRNVKTGGNVDEKLK